MVVIPSSGEEAHIDHLVCISVRHTTKEQETTKALRKTLRNACKKSGFFELDSSSLKILEHCEALRILI